MRGLFVTGTGTGVGKTVVAAAACAALRARGEAVAAYKPVVTGTEAPAGGGDGAWTAAAAGGDGAWTATAAGGDGAWPPDHELLARASGGRAEEVAPLVFGPAVSPHLAARLAGTEIDPAALAAAARERAAGGFLVAEGVGGLLVPLTPDYLVRDLARELGLPVLIAAAPGLGTINHTLLTLEAARAAGLQVACVVLTPWPESPSKMERSNRDTIARLGGVAVAGLPPTGPEPEALATAGEALPLDGWLS